MSQLPLQRVARQRLIGSLSVWVLLPLTDDGEILKPVFTRFARINADVIISVAEIHCLTLTKVH